MLGGPPRESPLTRPRSAAMIRQCADRRAAPRASGPRVGRVLFSQMDDDMAGMGMAMARRSPRSRLRGGLGRHDGGDDVAECLADDRLYAARIGTRAGPEGRVGRAVTAIYLGLWALTGVPDLPGKRALSAVTRRRWHTPCAGVLSAPDLPGLADQAGVLRNCRSPLGVPLRTLARGVDRAAGDGLGGCPVLSGLLLGAHGRFWRWSAQWGYPGSSSSRRSWQREARAGGAWVARLTGVVLVLMASPSPRVRVSAVAPGPAHPRCNIVGDNGRASTECHGERSMADQRRVLEGLQLVTRCGRARPRPGGAPDQGLLRGRPRLPGRARRARQHEARRAELRRPAAHARPDGPG